MNSQSYFSSPQPPPGLSSSSSSSSTAALTSADNCFPSNHRTNPHYHQKHLHHHQQQQQQQPQQQRDFRCGIGGQELSNVGLTCAQNLPPSVSASGASLNLPDPCSGDAAATERNDTVASSSLMLLHHHHHNQSHLLSPQQCGFGYPDRLNSYPQTQPRLQNQPQHPTQFGQIPHQQLRQSHGLPPAHQHWYPGYPPQRNHLESALGCHPSQGSTWMAQAIDGPATTAAPAATSKFPDSPPDSGSEPYSPPNEIQPSSESAAFSAKLSTVSAMATVMPSHMFMDPRGTSTLHNLHPGQGTTAAYHPDQHQVGVGHPQNAQPPHPSGMGLAFSKSHFGFYGPMEPMKLNTPDLSQRLVPPPSMAIDHHELQPQYHSGVHNANNQPPKKRKYSDSPPGTLTPGVLMNTLGVSNILPIKPEPCPTDLRYGMAPDCSEDDSFSYDYPPDAGMFVDGMYQVIKWTVHQPVKWVTLLDDNRQELAGLNYRVDADKGFNFSTSDDAFVCQKKNHFQITVHINVAANPRFIKLPESSTVVSVDAFYLLFYGIKMESPAQTIKIEQSQSDRSKKLFNPVKIDLYGDQVHKVTIGRLHFSETTSNNMRKKGKPNPDQRYFQLVVALQAHCGDGEAHLVAAHASERIIVRASNPGQFENDSEVIWNKGKVPEAIFHAGRVGINTDSPDEALTVHGNVKVTGHMISPSDVRVKKDFSEIDTSEQLKNISQLKVYKYTFNEEFAEFAGLSDDDRFDTGVLAQEVSQILPDAVRETGDVLLPGGETIDNFLVVNKDRIFIENVGAVKELCKVTDKLENRITEIELINKKLAKFSKTNKYGSVTLSGSSVCASGDSFGNSTISRSASSTSSASPSSQSQKHCTRHRHRHHHHCSRPSNTGVANVEQQEPVACSGRLIQIIVIILVIIMAICLLSITVLYVLDRKNMPQPSVALDQNQGPSATDHTTSAIPAPTVSRPASDHLLLPPQCLEKVENCPIRCCGMTTEFPPDDPGHLPVVTFPTSSTKKWFKSTKSPNDVDYNEIDDGPYSKPTDNGLPVPSHRFSSVQSTWKRFTSPVVTQGNQIEDLLQKEPQMNKSNRDKNNDINRTPKKVSRFGSNRSRRDEGLQSQVALVYIKQLNETLSSSYCVTSDCSQKRGGNYTYSIPVSPNFPPLFVTLQFVPLATSPGVTVVLCKEVENAVCSETRDESNYLASQVSAFEWDLPVGFYSRLYFKFRLTTTETTNNVCNLSDSDIGKSFAEYSFSFYRQCL